VRDGAETMFRVDGMSRDGGVTGGATCEHQPASGFDEDAGSGEGGGGGGGGSWGDKGEPSSAKGERKWPWDNDDEEKEKEGLIGHWNLNIPPPGVTDAGIACTGQGRGMLELTQTTQGIAFAALAAVLTLSIIHFLVGGIANSSASPLDGVLRTIGAALLILAWPWIIDQGLLLANAVKDVIPNDARAWDVNSEGYWDSNSTPVLVAIITGLVSLVLYLALFLTKVGLHAALLILTAAMPLALVMWPIPSLAWLPSACLRWCAAIAVIPVAWRVTQGVYDAMWGHLIDNDGDLERLATAMTVIALLALMVKIPGVILRTAGLIPGGAGFISRMGSFVAARHVSNAVSRVLPDRLGGSRDTLRERRAHQLAAAQRRPAAAPSSKTSGPRAVQSGGRHEKEWRESHRRSLGETTSPRVVAQQSERAWAAREANQRSARSVERRRLNQDVGAEKTQFLGASAPTRTAIVRAAGGLSPRNQAHLAEMMTKPGVSDGGMTASLRSAADRTSNVWEKRAFNTLAHASHRGELRPGLDSWMPAGDVGSQPSGWGSDPAATPAVWGSGSVPESPKPATPSPRVTPLDMPKRAPAKQPSHEEKR
jgi:hypothetical protein